MREPAPICSKPENDLFSYTSGRYLYNEKLRLAERYVEFNVEALKEVAAKSVGRNNVVRMIKLAEGGFNRVFLLTMNDGFEVIAKVPFRLTVPKHLTTESEVATLDFLRSQGIPVPRVYTWSSEASNTIRTEYVIMEKAAGKPLQERWFSLTPKERVMLVTSYVDIEGKLFSIPFDSYGSLYYKANLPSHLQADLYRVETSEDDGASRFCMGPATDYMFWRGRHAQLDVNRGPWRDPHQYLLSVGLRELEWTRKFGKPQRNDFPHNDIVEGEISPEIYIDLLEKYLSLSPYLLPKDRENPLNRPTLRHPDLNPTNIFVSESCEVSCVIDWQHTTILPLLLTAGNPPAFDNPNAEPPKDFKKPTLPEDYESLDPEEKSQADELHRRRMLFWLYMVFNGKNNNLHIKALYYPLRAQRHHLVDRAGRQWSGNTITLKGALLRVISSWDRLTAELLEKPECPVQFSKEDEEEFYGIEEEWFQMNILVDHWRSVLDDVGQDGWLRNESYDEVVEKNRQIKQEWLDEAQNAHDVMTVEKHWPFGDQEEID